MNIRMSKYRSYTMQTRKKEEVKDVSKKHGNISATWNRIAKNYSHRLQVKEIRNY